MRHKLYDYCNAFLRASFAGVLVVLACQPTVVARPQAQGQDTSRQLVQPAPSAPPVRRERRVALVIGNSAYRNASRLANPVNDARDVTEVLRSLGFEVILKEDQTAIQMREAVIQFGVMLRNGGGVGLFYYAGHGIQVGGRNYLIPVEANALREERIEFDAVDVNRVLAEMEMAGNGFNIVVLDACRSNPFLRGWRSSESGLAQLSAPGGTLIAYATGPGRVADDGQGRNGIYTGELLKQMKVPGQTVEATFKAVRARVEMLTKKKQTPWESTSLVGDFYFAGATADPTAVEKEFWHSVKDSQNPEDLKDYIREYPNGIYEKGS